MAKRETIAIISTLVICFLILVIIIYLLHKPPQITTPFPHEDEKARFIKYLLCSMAICSGKAQKTSSCSKDICASPEVLGLGMVDEDKDGNIITCRKICESITQGNCLEKMCNEQYSIEFTFKESVNISQNDILKLRPYGRVMHWCCNPYEEGWGWHLPFQYVRGRGGLIYPDDTIKSSCGPNCNKLEKSSCGRVPGCYWIGCLVTFEGNPNVPRDISKDECENNCPGISCIWVGCGGQPEFPLWCDLNKGKKVKIYGFEDENICSGPYLSFLWEVCYECGGYYESYHVCSSVKIAEA